MAVDIHETLLSTLSSAPHAFLQPSPALHADALACAKSFLDPLAAVTSEAQEARIQASRRKRKRGDADPINPQHVLRLKELHINGFHISQIWEQARRALDAHQKEIETSLKRILPDDESAHLRSSPSGSEQPSDSELSRVSKNGEEPDEMSGEVYDDDDDDDDDVNGVLQVSPNGIDQDQHGDGLDKLDHNMEEEDLGDGMSSEEEDNVDVNDIDMVEKAGERLENGFDSEGEELADDVFVPDRHGLNDGFFSIDDFNRQSDFLEQQDARGEDDGAASDEEDIEWGVDPNSLPVPTAGIGNDQKHNLEESEDDEAGPTFGNADLNGLSGSDSEDISDDELSLNETANMSNTNNIRYADFFAPPPRKASKASRRGRSTKAGQSNHSKPTEGDIQRAISAVKRDIFEDDMTPPASDSEGSTKAKKSSHEKRQAALASEIRRLEAAALAKRDWQLSGEARASQRPLNSLLEEDLDFERVGKPVPVITQEVSEDIEDLIKRRILNREFDEVIRRRPGVDAAGTQQQASRRGLADDLSTDKPSESLSALYENAHLRRTDPASHPDPVDAATKVAQAEITQLWKEVSAQLDALTSWHFRPKPPDISVNIVSDVPALRIEDARPAGVEAAGAPMLAPQEIYKPGAGEGDYEPGSTDPTSRTANRKEDTVTPKSGLPISKEEMTREERRRRRRREKERLKKANGNNPLQTTTAAASSGSNAAKRTAQVTTGRQGKGREGDRKVINELQKSSASATGAEVKIIGRKGDVRDVRTGSKTGVNHPSATFSASGGRSAGAGGGGGAGVKL